MIVYVCSLLLYFGPISRARAHPLFSGGYLYSARPGSHSRFVDGSDPVHVVGVGSHIRIGVRGRVAPGVRHVVRHGVLTSIGISPQYPVAGDAVIAGGVPAEGHRAVRIGGAVPVRLRGAPGGSVGTAAATSPVAELVSVSSFPASSVKLTSTLMVWPSSTSTRV